MPYVNGLYYEEHGSRFGELLILVSGLGGSADYWKPNMAALAPPQFTRDREYRVIVFDQRGTGRSERTISDTPTIEAIAEDILSLIQELRVPYANILGHAIGGMAGMVAAIAEPSRVKRLIVVNGWARADAYTRRCFNTRLKLLKAGGPRDYIHAQPIFLYTPHWTSDHDAELAAEEDHLIAALPDLRILERRIADALAFDISRDISRITSKTLLIASEDDALVPLSCSERIWSGMTNNVDRNMERMRWGGHACNVTQPDTFNKLVLDFLGS